MKLARVVEANPGTCGWSGVRRCSQVKLESTGPVTAVTREGLRGRRRQRGIRIVAALLQVLAEWNRSRDERALRQALARLLAVL